MRKTPTTLRRFKIASAIFAVVVAIIGYYVYSIAHMLNHLPEAYSAWDTGTLLVEYMKRNDDRWPSSWEDLAQMTKETDVYVMLRGKSGDDAVQYVRSLNNTIAVDWRFDPRLNKSVTIVTPKSGGTFSVVWSGADPNEMVHDYLKQRASTRPSTRP